MMIATWSFNEAKTDTLTGGLTVGGDQRFPWSARRKYSAALGAGERAPASDCLWSHQRSPVLAVSTRCQRRTQLGGPQIADLAEGPTAQVRDDIGQQTGSNRPP
jgi:hypothetical protein